MTVPPAWANKWHKDDYGEHPNLLLFMLQANSAETITLNWVSSWNPTVRTLSPPHFHKIPSCEVCVWGGGETSLKQLYRITQ